MSIPFSAGTSGYSCYRIPALTVTAAGTVLALAEGRVNGCADNGNIHIVGRRSLDGGQTWQPLQVITQHGSDTAGNPTIVTDPASGDLVLLSCYNRAADTSPAIDSGQAPARRVYVQRSADDGVTWSSPVEITSQVRASWMRWYATGPGTGAAMLSGRLVIPANHTRAPAAGSGDTGAEPAYSGGHCIISDDGGVTWRIGFTSSNPNGSVNENESSVALLPDGRLYFNCRDEGGSLPGNRADAYSLDGGETLPITYRPQATITGPMVQGHVLAVADALLFSGPTHPTDRAAMAIWASHDAGVTWDVVHRVTGLPAAYSCMAVVDEQTIALAYETGDWSPYSRIELVTLRLPQLGILTPPTSGGTQS